MPQTETAIEISQLGRVFVPVSDQDQALDFYTRHWASRSARHPVRRRPALDRGRAGRGRGRRRARRAAQGDPVGIETNASFSTPDVEKAHAGSTGGRRRRRAGHALGDPVPPMFRFRDPDGNYFMLVEQR